MRFGSWVRLLGILEEMENPSELPTKSTFERCFGKAFAVAEFHEYCMAELAIDSVAGNLGETIWVETEFLELPTQ
jgi:hypothetical protein